MALLSSDMSTKISIYAFLFLTSAMLGCGPALPRYESHYIFHDPNTSNGLGCVGQCNQIKKQCDEIQEMKRRECENNADLAQRTCEWNIRQREHRDSKWYECWRDSCSTDYETCNKDYRVCYQNCGGQITLETVCVSNCDKIPQPTPAPVATKTQEKPLLSVSNELPRRADRYLSSEPFKMPHGFPRTPDAFNDRKTVKGKDVFFETKMTLAQIAKFYRKKLTKYGLTEVQANSSVADAKQSLVMEFSGWPTKDRLEIVIQDEAYYTPNDTRWVMARFRWNDEQIP